jgi:endonuclease/exonuclease/phosphatase family metal-dependent hydrolase
VFIAAAGSSNILQFMITRTWRSALPSAGTNRIYSCDFVWNGAPAAGRASRGCITVKFLTALLCLLPFSHAFPALLLRETFDYTNGPLTVVSGGAWSQHSGNTANQVNVASGEAQLTSGESEDVNRAFLGQPFPTNGATRVFYARFTARFTSLPSAGGAWFAAFKDGSDTGFRARIFALTSGAINGQFRLGLSATTNSAATVTNTTDLALNTPFTVVLRLANTNSAATLWLNPASEGDPSIATTEAASPFTVAAFAFRQNTGMGTLTIDDLVVAPTFAEATAAASLVTPFLETEPPSQIVPRGSNVVFTAAASGAAPLRYQWLFNEQPVPGATNTALALTNLALAAHGNYRIAVTNVFGTMTSAPALLNVSITMTGATNVALTLLNYNAHGAAIPDWSTNSPQVQAIGQQVQFLDPDIITFQEIPMTNSGWTQMTNFVTAFRPGYYLATNSGHDGFIRSVILSRFPITRSAKWLDGIPLTSFGDSGFFTRDLFEAEIAVPGWPQPLHVFTTHLKSGQADDETLKRAAEARAISNFFANTFRPANPLRPYLLTGDMNEDVNNPPDGGAALPTLANLPTDLRIATPLNPQSGSHLTFSIRATSLTRRYDYVLPNALLFTNLLDGQIFRTDLATNISPALPGDATNASDHLPVFVRFQNPYAVPPRIFSFNMSNAVVRMNWSAVPGGRYRVEASTNLPAWTPLATNLLATNEVLSFTTNASGAARFLRVRTEP